MNSITLHCPAKINLFLEVGPRRRDGYHSLNTILASLRLSDRLLLKRRLRGPAGAIDFRLQFAKDYPATWAKLLRRGIDQNLAMRAYRLLSGQYPQIRSVPLTLTLVKKIPIQAGLGGGSSDAAGVLVGVNQLLNLHIPWRNLLRMARVLGSDVPFFLHCMRDKKIPCFWASGRGEHLKRLAAPKIRHVLLVHPGFGMATSRAYQLFDQDGAAARLTSSGILPTLKQELVADCQQWRWLGTNSFESVLMRQYALLRRLKSRLRREGALAVGVSGSGSCLYAMAKRARECRGWVRKMKQAGLSRRLRYYVTAIE
ncbi:MAG: 4-(cytidine 5'-diphospho)-2-C-methyl-D-erythritol kinase [Elusimicrobia bacterium]|nr:4-(cytidine 5'-diphospho)-2-C-methyl-D-erythritol kinase [Elusimicrobiota bacterium]